MASPQLKPSSLNPGGPTRSSPCRHPEGEMLRKGVGFTLWGFPDFTVPLIWGLRGEGARVLP